MVWGFCSKGRTAAGFFSCCVSTDQDETVFQMTWLAFLGFGSQFLPRVLRKEISLKCLESRWRHSHQPTSLYSSEVRDKFLRSSCSFMRRVHDAKESAKPQESQLGKGLSSTCDGRNWIHNKTIFLWEVHGQCWRQERAEHEHRNSKPSLCGRLKWL